MRHYILDFQLIDENALPQLSVEEIGRTIPITCDLLRLYDKHPAWCDLEPR